MRQNKNGQKAVDRLVYRTMKESGINMDSFYIEGQGGGLIAEYMESNPDCPLTRFVESMDGQTQWSHERSDGTGFDIRVNGANWK
tara:strand:+ start:87 stop:341 length:255 start_codon:yes stop_codon:yes gene_type:complete